MTWIRFENQAINLSHVQYLEMNPSPMDKEYWTVDFQIETGPLPVFMGRRDECQRVFDALVKHIDRFDLVQTIEKKPIGDAIRAFFGFGKEGK